MHEYDLRIEPDAKHDVKGCGEPVEKASSLSGQALYNLDGTQAAELDDRPITQVRRPSALQPV